jgi:hypothetical protein
VSEDIDRAIAMSESLTYPKVLQVSPIRRLSPSQYTSFKTCFLKGVLAANKVPGSLPNHPKAYLGTIIHSLIAKGTTGQISDFSDFQLSWDKSLASIEEELGRSALTRHLLPLKRHIPNMADSKFRCWDTVKLNIRSINKYRIVELDGHRWPRTISEVWVQTPDGLLGGFIDSVARTSEGTFIVEYKTGGILSNDGSYSDEEASIKPEYLTQVSLYAGLYYQTIGQWPVGVIIASVSGEIFEIQYDRDNCLSLIHQAKKDLAITNCTIRKSYRNNYDVLDKLANPSIQACAHCNYRPSCERYWQVRQSHKDGWPMDFDGILKEVKEFGDETQLIRLENKDIEGQIITVRKINKTRHDLSNDIGRELKIYNLNLDSGENNFKAGALTTMYYSK